MPAHTEERESAEQEGVRMNWLRTITEMGEEDLTVEIMELDEEGIYFHFLTTFFNYLPQQCLYF